MLVERAHASAPVEDPLRDPQSPREPRGWPLAAGLYDEEFLGCPGACPVYGQLNLLEAVQDRHAGSVRGGSPEAAERHQGFEGGGYLRAQPALMGYVFFDALQQPGQSDRRCGGAEQQRVVSVRVQQVEVEEASDPLGVLISEATLLDGAEVCVSAVLAEQYRLMRSVLRNHAPYLPAPP
ncbi:hypothetical protein GCM10010252_22890 [Streptomyces aureoverticillatus]|nr:hypothetical protein GCM10010252_22890 [Streptomyces aureoverticillatus]